MTFRSMVFCGLLFAWSAAWAQQPVSGTSETSPELSQEERDAEGASLRARRAALEQSYQQDVKACYQKFDVASCRTAAREKRIAVNEALRKEELRYNARERNIAAQEAQQRLQERQQEAQRKAEEAQNATPKPPKQQTDEATKRQNEISQRDQYEQKQREAQERRQNFEQRLRERDKPPAAPLPLPGAAK